jgi:predicted nucleic acid-binding protein
MTLIDTNVIIDVQDPNSPFHKWARVTLETCVLSDCAAVNLITIAELISGGIDAQKLDRDLRELGARIEDISSGAAEISGVAYKKYRAARRLSSGGTAPNTPLPDFFIGAHAEFSGWKLATRDGQRFKAYFPKVTLIEP